MTTNYRHTAEADEYVQHVFAHVKEGQWPLFLEDALRTIRELEDRPRVRRRWWHALRRR